ncbi:MAG: high-potential iron-sulfur protein [Deltaproteobacteria bacterium]|nr:high-potential iron-sulfur protein [Deltaproteobacteria bacterium]
MNSNVSRRGFLTRLGVGALVVGGTAALAACGKSGGGDAQCKDPTGASDALRKQNEYTDKATDPQKKCSGCALFVAGDASCGKCTLFQNSPVSPEGGCKAWAKKA